MPLIRLVQQDGLVSLFQKMGAPRVVSPTIQGPKNGGATIFFYFT